MLGLCSGCLVAGLSGVTSSFAWNGGICVVTGEIDFLVSPRADYYRLREAFCFEVKLKMTFECVSVSMTRLCKLLTWL